MPISQLFSRWVLMRFSAACGSFIFVIARVVLRSVLSVQYKSYLPSQMHELSQQAVSRLVGSRLLNAVFFQIGWFACVLGGDLIAVAVDK